MEIYKVIEMPDGKVSVFAPDEKAGFDSVHAAVLYAKRAMLRNFVAELHVFPAKGVAYIITASVMWEEKPMGWRLSDV